MKERIRPMASSKWKTWEELSEKAGARKVVFWGASNWIERTLDHMEVDAAFVVDGSTLNQGTVYCGLDVVPPQKLTEIDRDAHYVVITTGNYESVIESLHGFGWVMGEEFCCTPLLNERRHVDELVSHTQKVLLTSPEHFASETAGGGLYRYSLPDHGVDKLYVGKCRGVARSGGKTFVVDMLRGVVILDEAYVEIGLVELEPNSEPHGLCVDAANNRLFVATPGRDSVAQYNLTSLKLENEIHITGKWHRNRKDNHHVNDLCLHENSLYVSLFSMSGNWLHDAFDGGVIEIDLETGTVLGPVVSGLWMPHSVSMISGKLTYIDSMRASLHNSSWTALGRFNGFVRGLDHDGKYYFLGVSRHRYPERLPKTESTISLDTGFYVFDAETRMSRFFNMYATQTIHSLVVED